MKPESRFRQLIHSKYGARALALDSLSDFQRVRVLAIVDLGRSVMTNYIEQHILSINPNNVYVGIFASQQVQAFAHSSTNEPAYIIGLSVGMIAACDRIWNRLVNSGCFYRIGSSGKSMTNGSCLFSTTFFESNDTCRDAETILSAASNDCLPINGEAAKFAAEMSALTLYFCILHEAAHVIGGHSLWRRAVGMQDLVSEMASSACPDDSRHVLECHALELIADHFAFETLLSRLANPVEHSSFDWSIEKGWWSEQLGTSIAGKTNAPLAQASAAAACLFLLFLSGGNRGSNRHPDFWHRILWILLQDSHIVTKPSGDPFETDAGWQAAMAVWEAYKTLGLPSLRVGPHDQTVTELSLYEEAAKIVAGLVAPYSWDAYKKTF